MGPDRRQQIAAQFETAPWRTTITLTRLPRCPFCGQLLNPSSFSLVAEWAVCHPCATAHGPHTNPQLHPRTAELLWLFDGIARADRTGQSLFQHGIRFWTPLLHLANSAGDQSHRFVHPDDPPFEPPLPDAPPPPVRTNQFDTTMYKPNPVAEPPR